MHSDACTMFKSQGIMYCVTHIESAKEKKINLSIKDSSLVVKDVSKTHHAFVMFQLIL